MEYKGSQGVYTLAAQPMKSGGEGSIYALQSHPNMVAKIYHPQKLSSELEEKISFMTNNPPESTILDQIAWPLDVLRDFSGRFVGFVMPKLSIDTDLKAIYAYPPNPKIPITYEQKVIVAINICVVISAIHKAGYTFGDFNPLNIGINLKNGHVAFLDTDSYHIKDTTSGKVYRCEVCLDGYVAPELIQHCKGTDFAHAALPTFTQETDRFALAIHVFKLLMNGYTPFNGIKEGESASQASPGVGNLAIERDNYCFKPGNKPQSVATPNISSLTPDLQYLFKKTFIGGANDPLQRATADEWLHALCEYKDNLTRCSKDPSHYYYVNNNACPYCEADKKYNKSMAKATTPNSQAQMNFGTPVNVPSQSNQLNQLYQKNKKSKIKRILLWIFFFPIMLSIKIGKSKMRLIWKIILISYCIRLGLVGVIGVAALVHSAFDFDDVKVNQNQSEDKNQGQNQGQNQSQNQDIITTDGYLLQSNGTGYTISVADGYSSKLTGIVEIPREYNGTPITSISEDGFANCTEITAITVPTTVTYIGEGAFKGCTSIQSITIPFIGQAKDAQYYNERVLGYIFGCERIERKTSYIYKDAIYNDKPSEVVGTTWQFSAQNAYSDLRYDFYYYIPQSLKYVHITTQTNVPDFAFNGCKNLVTITMPPITSSGISIGDAAFQDCQNLEVFGASSNTLEIKDGIVSIGANAFSNCVKFKKIIVSNTVRRIGEGAFKGCSNIESISVPFIGNSEDAINEKAVLGYIFGYEIVEKKVTEHYGSDTAHNDQPINIIGATWQFTWQNAYSYTRESYYYYIPDSLRSVVVTKQTSVPAYAFNGCFNITNIDYLAKASGPVAIGDAAFQNCPNLEFGNENDGRLVFDGNLVSIGDYAFNGCVKIKEIIVPNTVRTIGEAAFKGCNNLTSITTPFVGNSEDAINEKAVLGYIFGYEIVEKKVTEHYGSDTAHNDRPIDMIGATWQFTWQNAYSYTRQYFYYYIPGSLTTVTITKQTAIPNYAFNGCANLIMITLPVNSTYGEASFQYCAAEIIQK